MDLIFPFKNIAFNGLLGFVEQEEVKDFFKYVDKEEMFPYFEKLIENYNGQIPDFENEILQIIETSSQDTIDTYFDKLVGNVNYATAYLKEDNIRQLVKEWNASELAAFTKRVAEKEEKYFQESNRSLKHLEKYEDNSFLATVLGYSKKDSSRRLKTNYNFYCVEEQPELIDESRLGEFHSFIQGLYRSFLEVGKRYGIPWEEGKIKSKLSTVQLKPIVFFEGEIDLDLVRKAAELLGEQELLEKVELRQRGSAGHLTKLWNILTQNNWESVPQKKMLIYDCDTNAQDEDFGHIFKRTLPKQDNMICRGIENLFPDTFINQAIAVKSAYVDLKKITGTRRGVTYEEVENTINGDEKRNFCTWACENGTAEDFKNFKLVFDMIRLLL